MKFSVRCLYSESHPTSSTPIWVALNRYHAWDMIRSNSPKPFNFDTFLIFYSIPNYSYSIVLLSWFFKLNENLGLLYLFFIYIYIFLSVHYLYIYVGSIYIYVCRFIIYISLSVHSICLLIIRQCLPVNYASISLRQFIIYPDFYKYIVLNNQIQLIYTRAHTRIYSCVCV